MINIYFKVLLVAGGLFYPGFTTDEETDCLLLLSWQQSRGDSVELELFQRFTKF